LKKGVSPPQTSRTIEPWINTSAAKKTPDPYYKHQKSSFSEWSCCVVLSKPCLSSAAGVAVLLGITTFAGCEQGPPAKTQPAASSSAITPAKPKGEKRDRGEKTAEVDSGASTKSEGHSALRKLGVRVQGLESNALNIKGHVVRLQEQHLTPEGTIKAEVLEPLKEVSGLILGIDGTNLTDAGLEQISPLTQITSLSLISCRKITNAGMAHLGGFTQLQSLFLNNTKISDAGLQSLKDLKSLNELNLFGTEITDAGLEYVGGMENLSSLSLISCREISDAGFSHLHNLKKLRMLWLINTKIGDEGLKQIDSENPLEEVALNNTKITSKGVDEFRKTFPDCVVVGR
jgi:hypothetical protein